MSDLGISDQGQLSGTTALVTGASRGFGRAVAATLARSGAQVVAVARDRGRLDSLRAELGEQVTVVAADVTDPVVAGELLDAYRPRTLVLAAGAAPLSRPLQHHTWESFSRTWEVDVRQAFHWTREALLQPLEPGSTVIAFSSGAALFGSPISGGYAGSKATIRFLTGYAADESERHGLSIRFISVLPQLTPETDLGAAAVAGYAARAGVTVPEFLASRGPALTPAQVGQAVTRLAEKDGGDPGAYLVSAEGLKPVS
jgi:NAD(P)-dependent dehydrogenase (short-subunit alcohol dehydrogenase family)